MEPWHLYLMVGIAALAATVAGWLVADRVAQHRDRQPETQDDLRAFHVSAERWGHLPDRRGK